ncbi:MAG: serine hydrolase, partial [Verrucomicrobiota bacterium]
MSACQTTKSSNSSSNETPKPAAAGQSGPQFARANLPQEDVSKLGPVPHVNAAAFVVVNARNGQILASKNPHQRRHVASTQKLLTALVLMDSPNLEKTITVSQSDTWVSPTKMGIRAGQRYKKRDLLQAMLIRSSNDIAACLARSHAGSEAAFVRMMNAKAAKLGMRNSRFANAHGLTASNQYSTAYDIAILATHAMNNPWIHKVTQTREMVFRFPDGNEKL